MSYLFMSFIFTQFKVLEKVFGIQILFIVSLISADWLDTLLSKSTINCIFIYQAGYRIIIYIYTILHLLFLPV